MRSLLVLGFILSFVLIACSDDEEGQSDASLDASATVLVDAGSAVDAGSEDDAGR